ncbi:MAG: FRG domain-containing protein [Bacteroidota bacterium]
MSGKKFIRSVNDLLESIEFTNLKRENLAFRGQVNKEWEITSTIMRDSNGSPLDFRKSKEIEYASLKSLLQGNKSEFCRTYHPLEHLMHLQHLSIPTRLIDWTRDILVALFFSCFDKNNLFTAKHGKIFLLLIMANEFKNFDLFYEKQNINFKNYNISLIQKSLMDDLMHLSEIKIIEPMLKNPRMRIQDGIFTLTPLWKSDEKIG